MLTLLATDIEIEITTATSDTSGDGDAAVTVAAKKLLEICAPRRRTCWLAWLSRTGACSSRREKPFTFRRYLPMTFPAWLFLKAKSRDLRSAKLFRRLLAQTQYSMAALGHVRYYLNGLLLLLEANEWRAVATDDRLAYASGPLEDAAVTVPDQGTCASN